MKPMIALFFGLASGVLLAAEKETTWLQLSVSTGEDVVYHEGDIELNEMIALYGPKNKASAHLILVKQSEDEFPKIFCAIYKVKLPLLGDELKEKLIQDVICTGPWGEHIAERPNRKLLFSIMHNFRKQSDDE